MYTEEQLKSLLASKGFKLTRQRLAIYKALSTLKHPFAEEVIERSKQLLPELTVATVYNTLDSFVEKGLIRKLKTVKDKMRYDSNPLPHHHIYGTNQEQMIDYCDPDLDHILEEYFKHKRIEGCEIVEYSLSIKGKLDCQPQTTNLSK